MFAGVAELADAPDLGSGGITVGVQVPSPAPKRKVAQAAFSFCTFHSSLFTFHFSLTLPRDFSREEIRKKREKKRQLFSCAFGALVEKH